MIPIKEFEGVKSWRKNDFESIIQINESVKSELDELKYEFQLMQGSLNELKNDNKSLDAITNKLSREAGF